MENILTAEQTVTIWTALIGVVSVAALLCWAYAMRVCSRRLDVFRDGEFSWFESSRDTGSREQSRSKMLGLLTGVLQMPDLAEKVDEPATLAEAFTRHLQERPWMHQLRGKESLLKRIHRAFADDGENRTYFPAIEQRILAITSMVKESNASQFMPHLSDLSQMTRERDDSRVTVQVFNCVCSVVLLMGICGTLYGIGKQLQGTGISSLSVLRDSLLPSAMAVLAAAILRGLREVYQASAESFYTRLDRFTMLVLVPLFQPLTDLKGESERFRRLIRTLDAVNPARTSSFFEVFHNLCTLLLTSEEKIRRIEEVIVTRLQRTREAQHNLMQQMAALLGGLKKYAGVLERSLVVCHGVLVHYHSRPELPTAAASNLDAGMSRLLASRAALVSPESLHSWRTAWEQGLAAYKTLQNSIEYFNRLVAEVNMGTLHVAYTEMQRTVSETLPGYCKNWKLHKVQPIAEGTCGLWSGVHEAFATHAKVWEVADSMCGPMNELGGMSRQLRDELRMNKAQMRQMQQHLNLDGRMGELESHLNHIYLTRCWENLTHRRLKEAWRFLQKWLELGGVARKHRLADRAAIIIQLIILYLF